MEQNNLNFNNEINNSNNNWLGLLYDFCILIVLAIIIMFLVSSSYNPFIYFRF